MLFTPGPVEIEKGAFSAQCNPIISHRSPAFRELFKECTEGIKKLFQTNNRAYILTTSGTGAIEACLVNSIRKEDRVLCLNNGEFGNRLSEMCKLYSDSVEVSSLEWGKGFSIDNAKEKIDSFKPTFLAMVQNDTSTGVENKVVEIASYAKKNGARVFVDAVSSLGGTKLKFDDWNIDVCASASQKCLALPPGLGFVAVNNDFYEQVIAKREKIPSFFFDLRKQEAFAQKNETPFTPAVQLFFSLKAALDKYFAEGVDRRIEAHRQVAAKVRKSVSEIGMECFAESGFESNTITTVKTERAEEIKERLSKEFNIEIALGMKDYKKNMIRIAHMGEGQIDNMDFCLNAIRDITLSAK